MFQLLVKEKEEARMESQVGGSVEAVEGATGQNQTEEPPWESPVAVSSGGKHQAQDV